MMRIVMKAPTYNSLRELSGQTISASLSKLHFAFHITNPTNSIDWMVNFITESCHVIILDSIGQL
jgi:hypothetical protein